MITFIVNVLVLFAAQFAVGILWYSVLFKALFAKLSSVDVKVDTKSTQEVVGLLYKWQLISNLAKSIFVSLIVWIIPMNFGSYFVVFLFIMLIPAILLGSNLRFGSKPMELILLESGQIVVSFLVMFLLAFIIKAAMN